MQIVWSGEAKSDYSRNIEYLLEKWGLDAAREFADNVANILNQIVMMPGMFPTSGYKKVRKVIACRQISILYKVEEQRIVLLRFWDNRQDPGKFKVSPENG